MKFMSSISITILSVLMLLPCISSASSQLKNPEGSDIVFFENCRGKDSKQVGTLLGWHETKESGTPGFDFLRFSHIDPAYAGIEEPAEYRGEIDSKSLESALRNGMSLKSTLMAYGDASLRMAKDVVTVSIPNLVPLAGEPSVYEFACKVDSKRGIK